MWSMEQSIGQIEVTYVQSRRQNRGISRGRIERWSRVECKVEAKPQHILRRLSHLSLCLKEIQSSAHTHTHTNTLSLSATGLWNFLLYPPTPHKRFSSLNANLLLRLSNYLLPSPSHSLPYFRGRRSKEGADRPRRRLYEIAYQTNVQIDLNQSLQTVEP